MALTYPWSVLPFTPDAAIRCQYFMCPVMMIAFVSFVPQNVDEPYSDDPLMCTQYVRDIYSFLRTSEVSACVIFGRVIIYSSTQRKIRTCI